ncbi:MULTISPECIES: hypothetical protein [unclassified Fibrobacter]|uniref:hypothetical protein n=1 Tax=unclassified Fibrobacter TaxID=2634177 RepID=UPI000D6AD7F0|nr:MULTISPECIES: hypothetical protein [unclassified Fibrobacter]
MIFGVLWFVIFAVLGIYLLRSPKVRGWLRVLKKAKLVWRIPLSLIILVAGVYWGYKSLPKGETYTTNVQAIFETYSAQTVQKVVDAGIVKKDSACDMSHARPEIAYIFPLVINTYNDIVERPTTPIITRLDDTLHFAMVGYRLFKNRGILINKALRKKLGNRYSFGIRTDSTSNVHTLWLTYTGDPWNIEQLCALPVIEISKRNNVDPALVMSLIRHVSNFNFDYQGQKDARGILALHEGTGLEQIELGVEKLRKLLHVGLSQENAIATFYPDPEMGAKPEDWMRSPLTKSWVDQVLGDVQYYKDNGI